MIAIKAPAVTLRQDISAYAFPMKIFALASRTLVLKVRETVIAANAVSLCFHFLSSLSGGYNKKIADLKLPGTFLNNPSTSGT